MVAEVTCCLLFAARTYELTSLPHNDVAVAETHKNDLRNGTFQLHIKLVQFNPNCSTPRARCRCEVLFQTQAVTNFLKQEPHDITFKNYMRTEAM